MKTLDWKRDDDGYLFTEIDVPADGRTFISIEPTGGDDDTCEVVYRDWAGVIVDGPFDTEEAAKAHVERVFGDA